MTLLSTHRRKQRAQPPVTMSASQTLIRVRGGYLPSVVRASQPPKHLLGQLDRGRRSFASVVRVRVSHHHVR